MKKTILPLLLLLTPAWVYAQAGASQNLPLENLNLPSGFHIAIYAEVPNARQMALGGDGIVYVGSRRLGKIHAVLDKDGDFKADQVIEIASDLLLPTGIAYRDGDLFVGAVSHILRYADIDNHLVDVPKAETLIDTLPDKTHHGWKYLAFGPDEQLYFAVGAPCNICLSEDPTFATILKMDINKPTPEIVAHGIRNTVGFDWHPITKELWFTDNNRDMMGDDGPLGELNRVRKQGDHFGYPFFHAKSQPDPEFGDKGDSASAYVEPALTLGPHVAALGMMFYTGDMFPAEYKNQVIMAEHGSWNRSPEAGHTGFRLTIGRDTDGKMSYETFIDGWLGADNESWGRPVHMVQLPDGSLLLSDDKAGVIYRISYRTSD